MRGQSFLTLVSLFVCLAGAGTAHAERVALLVQVANYRDAPGFQEQREPQVDVPRLKKVLVGSYGFRVLDYSDSRATREAILGALADLARKAKPEDSVLFYFSGLGARAGQQFAICPWDATRKSAGADITEEDLSKRIGAFQTQNVLVILDCCFTDAPVRQSNTRPYAKFMGRDSEGTQPASWPTRFPADRAILMTAAAPNEAAMQTAFARGEWTGTFTNFLVTELSAANPETTYRRLAELVKARVNRWQAGESACRESVQTPSIFGAPELLDRPLFAKGGKPEQAGNGAAIPVSLPLSPMAAKGVPPYIVVDSVGTTEVKLDRGSSAGITAGSRYTVFPDDEISFTDRGRQLGEIEVTSVAPDSAMARPVEGTDIKKVKPFCRAIFHARDVGAGTETVLTVYGKDVRARQRGMEAARRVLDSRERPLQVVDGGGDADPSRCASTEFALFVTAEGGMVVRGPEGSRDLDIVRVAPPADTPQAAPASEPAAATDAAATQLAATLAPQVEAFSVIRMFAKMENPTPGFNIELVTDKKAYTVGEKMVIRFRADRACHLVLLHVDQNGSPTLLHPRYAGQPTSVGSQQEYVFPPPGLTYRVRPPVGRDSVVALALGDEQRAEELAQALRKALDRGRGSGSVVQIAGKGLLMPSKGLEVVEERLNKVQAGDPANWAFKAINVQTVAAPAQ